MNRTHIALLLVFIAICGWVVFVYSPQTVSTILPVLAEEEELKVLFVGDIMLDRNVAREGKSVGAPAMLAGVQDLFDSTDLVVGNLEGTITTNESIAQRDHTVLRFTFDPTFAEAILKGRFDAVSLANNHALDFGEFGYDDTTRYLSQHGVKFFGQPYNDAYHLSTSIEVGNMRVCLVGYHSLFKSSYTMVVEEIRKVRSTCTKVVVMPHWGDEYEEKSNDAQKEAAHAFIDAGADLIVGSHPHVVQEVEIYEGKPVFYSLGNFMFDQNFSWETRHGLAVVVGFKENETSFKLIPVAIANGVVTVAEGDDRGRVLGAAGAVAHFRLP